MAILRWIHLRKLVPLTDLIQGLESARRARGLDRRAGIARERASGRPPPAAAAPARGLATAAAIAGRRGDATVKSIEARSRAGAAPSNRRRHAERASLSPPAI